MEYTIVIAKVPVCGVNRAVHLPNGLCHKNNDRDQISFAITELKD